MHKIFQMLSWLSGLGRSAGVRHFVRLGTALLFIALCLFLPVTGETASKKKGGPHHPQLTVDFHRNLEFGKVAGDHNGRGTVTIDPVTGNKTVAGYAFDLGKRHRPAEFRVKGPKNAIVIITLPNAFLVQNTLGAGRTRVRRVKSWPSGTATLDHKGRLKIMVGGTLVLRPGQPAGNYEGDFTIDVDLQ